LLVIDDSIRSFLRGGFRPDLIRNAARVNGMKRLQEDAIEKLQSGVTTLEEILRVVPFENQASADCTECGHELFAAFHYCPYCGTKRETVGPASLSEPTLTISDGVFSS
jgi:hypothetical protein